MDGYTSIFQIDASYKKINMKYFLFILFVGLLFLNFKDADPQSQLPGLWELAAVYEDSIDVTEKHDPFDERYIRFYATGAFESDGRPFTFNEGKWKLSKDQSILEIYSSVENDDSVWRIRIQDDRMEWKGVGSDWKEGFLLCFERKSK